MLRLRDFRWLSLGATLVNLASSMAPIVLAFAVLDRTGSATELGVVVGARSVATIALLLFGGVLADRLPKAALLRGTSVTAAIVQALVAAAVLARVDSIGLLAGLSALNGALSAIDSPTSSALLPDTVPAGRMRQASAVNRMGVNIGKLAGFGVGGLVVGLVGPGWGLVGNALSFGLAAVCFLGVRPRGTVKAGPASAGPGKVGPARVGSLSAGPQSDGPADAGPARAGGTAKAGFANAVRAKAGRANTDRAKAGRANTVRAKTVRARAGRAKAGRAQVGLVTTDPPTARANPFAELRDGWRMFVGQTWLWVVVAQFSVINMAIAGGVNVLGTAIAKQTFGPVAWGVVMATYTAGGVVGGLIAARTHARHALRIGVALSVCDGLPMLVLALAPTLLVLVPVMFLAGAALEQVEIAWGVSVQQRVPAASLARVYSYDTLGSLAAMPIGQLAAGPLAAHWGTKPVLLGGFGLVVAATIAALTSRSIRTMTFREPDSDPNYAE